MMTLRQTAIGAMVTTSLMLFAGQRAGAAASIVAVSATVRASCPVAVDQLADGAYAVSSTPEAVWVHAAAGKTAAAGGPAVRVAAGPRRPPPATCRVPLRQEVALDATRNGLVVTIAY